MDNLEILRLIRNILFRGFGVGLIIALVLGLVMMVGWTYWMNMAGAWFHTDPTTLTPLMLKFFVDIRFFLLFILLTPALAIHWTIKRAEEKK